MAFRSDTSQHRPKKRLKSVVGYLPGPRARNFHEVRNPYGDTGLPGPQQDMLENMTEEYRTMVHPGTRQERRDRWAALAIANPVGTRPELQRALAHDANMPIAGKLERRRPHRPQTLDPDDVPMPDSFPRYKPLHIG